METSMTPERYESVAEKPAAPGPAASAAESDTEAVLLAELQAMRLFRENIQGWVRRLTRQAALASPPSRSRHRCSPAHSRLCLRD
jgi:hypothetical protein